jgi:hypothetical protein
MFGFSSGKKKKKNALNISLEIISIPFNIELFFLLLLLLWSLETFFQQPTHPIRLRTTRGKSNYFSIIPSRQYIFPGKRNKKRRRKERKESWTSKKPLNPPKKENENEKKKKNIDEGL